MRKWLWIIVAFAVTFPALYVVFGGIHLYESSPLLGSFIYGVAIISSAFLLSWGAEVAELDVPAPVALSVLALIAVLPEYAVSFSLTYQAASNPAYQELAIANMVGANRTIVGFAWPLIVLLFWMKFGKRFVTLDQSQRVEVGYLGLAGLYSLIIPIKGEIDFIDVVILVSLFIVYTVRISRTEVGEPELIGPAQVIGSLPALQRRIVVVGMMAFAAVVIFLVAEPFAESLIFTATNFNIDRTFVVQWFAPIASEAPEIVVCVLFTLKGMANDGLGTLIASKVNQWTLLIGTLPVVYSYGSKGGVGSFTPLLLQGTFVENGITKNFDLAGSMLVTSCQTLLAVGIMLNLRAHLREAALLFVLFVAQFFITGHILGVDTHHIFAAIYMGSAIVFAALYWHEILATVRSMFDFRKQTGPKEHLIEEDIDKQREKIAHGG